MILSVKPATERTVEVLHVSLVPRDLAADQTLDRLDAAARAYESLRALGRAKPLDR
jgi:hypothetical protein